MAWPHSSNNLSNLPDQELIDRYRNSRDSQYLGTLYLRYIHLVYGAGRALSRDDEDAQALVQQVFEQLQQVLPGKQIPHFKEWLWETLLELTSSDQSTEITDQSPAFTTNFQLRSDSYTASQEKQIQEAIEELPEMERQCIYQFYFEKYSLTELQEATDLSFEKVLLTLQKGKRHVIQKLQNR